MASFAFRFAEKDKNFPLHQIFDQMTKNALALRPLVSVAKADEKRNYQDQPDRQVDILNRLRERCERV